MVLNPCLSLVPPTIVSRFHMCWTLVRGESPPAGLSVSLHPYRGREETSAFQNPSTPFRSGGSRSYRYRWGDVVRVDGPTLDGTGGPERSENS